MFKAKFSNGKIMSFSSKDNLLQYISENQGVKACQIVIKDKHISLIGKFGSVFAIIGMIE